MIKDLWLPYGYTFEDCTIKSILYADAEWQIFKASDDGSVLLLSEELTQRYLSTGLLAEEQLYKVKFGTNRYFALYSDKKYILSPVLKCTLPSSKVDALSFAVAIAETRKTIRDITLSDGIYLEQISRILPMYSEQNIKDENLLGMWLTGGMSISAKEINKISSLLISFTEQDLIEIVTTAGIELESTLCETIAHNSTEDFNKIESIFSLPGRPSLQKFFQEHILDVIQNVEKYKNFGIEFPTPVILHGPPGCGKTFAVEKLTEFINWPVYQINSTNIGSPYIHETSKKIGQLFDKAIENAPSVIVIDEMEAFLSDRKSEIAASHQIEEVAEFLRRIPEAITHKVLIIAMTNLIEKIDPAILRKGRFDFVIPVEMPSKEEVEGLVKNLFAKLPTNKNLIFDDVINNFIGKPLSDITFFVREVSRLCVKNSEDSITQEVLDIALEEMFKEENKKASKKIGFI